MKNRLTRLSLATFLVAAIVLSTDTVRGEDPPVPADRAHVQVKLPVPDASLVFGESLTESLGTDRLFESPMLKKDVDYTYKVTATWKEEGKEHKDVRVVTVKAGKKIVVDFTKPEDKPKDKDSAPKDKDAAPKDKDAVTKDKGPAPKDKDGAPKDKDGAPKDKDGAPKDKDGAPKDKDSAPKDKDAAPPKDKGPGLKDKDGAPKDKDGALKDKGPALKDKDKDAAPKDKDAAPKDKNPGPKDKDSSAVLETRRPLLLPFPDQ